MYARASTPTLLRGTRGLSVRGRRAAHNPPKLHDGYAVTSLFWSCRWNWSSFRLTKTRRVFNDRVRACHGQRCLSVTS